MRSAQVHNQPGHDSDVESSPEFMRFTRIYEVDLQRKSVNIPCDYEQPLPALSQSQVYLSEFRPMLRSGIVTVDDEFPTRRTWIHSAQTRRTYPYVGLLDSGTLRTLL